MRRTLISVFFLLLAAWNGSAAWASPVGAATMTTTQLPRNVRPTHYDITLIPDAKAMSFGGKVTIAIEVLEPTRRITLNALDLAFDAASLNGTSSTQVFDPPRIHVDNAAQTASFEFSRAIPKGSYRLTLDYSGKIRTLTTGMFALDYPSAAGSARALFTKFEPAYARRVIPSWDEPVYKASFAVTAIVPKGEMAISNMPIKQQSDLGNGKTQVQFATSPKMSTYLLFFGLGDLERATAQVGETELGVVVKKGSADQAAFVLDSSKAILREFIDYFGIPYPLPKLDNIAAPGRSPSFAAMENWGAILTFEYRILLDPAISTEQDKQRAFAITAHEMAHQWFGNLVTMSWWDDLWLNEGFATWMESRTTKRLHPEWNTALGVVEDRERAMFRDALATTHPVVQHVDTVEQASQAFDAITYDKGQAVIGMLENYVGDEAWRKGVRNYLNAHLYGSTVSADLWGAMDKASGLPVSAIAHDFTMQPGIPLIHVEAAKCNAGRTSLRLVQGEFSVDQADKKPLAWRVPVIAQALGSSAQARTVTTGRTTKLSVPGCAPVIVNAGQRGYYRTVYAPEHFRALAGNFAALTATDQLGILADSWSLGLAGLQPVTDFLALAQAVPANADPQVWGKLAAVFRDIHGYYRGDKQRQAAFDKFAVARLAPVFASLGWTAVAAEPGAVAIAREQLIAALSELGDPALIAEARRRYAVQASDPAAIPAPLRNAILGVVARHADAAGWAQLRATAAAEKSPLVRERLYQLLSLANDESLARQALELALTPEPGETVGQLLIRGVSELHPDLAFDFVLAHLDEVNAKIDKNARGVFFPRLARDSADPATIAKVNAYASEHLAPGARRNAETTVANIAYRIKVRQQRLPAIDTWLAAH